MTQSYQNGADSCKRWQEFQENNQSDINQKKLERVLDFAFAVPSFLALAYMAGQVAYFMFCGGLHG